MTGIAYCVKYHIENLACEINRINFSPIADTKDREADKNRRAQLYVMFAKKYLPLVLGIKKDEIQIRGEDTSDVSVILPRTFGGGGTIGGTNDGYEDEDDTDIVAERISDIEDMLDNSDLPSDYSRDVISELNLLHRNGDLSEGDMPSISSQDISDLERVFQFLDFVGEDWGMIENNFGDRRYEGAVDLLFNYASRFRGSRIIEDMVFKMGIGSSYLIDLIEHGTLEFNVVDALNRLIAEFPENIDGRLLASLIRHIQSNPDSDDWHKIDWNDIEDLESTLDDIAEDVFEDGNEFNKFKNAVGISGTTNIDPEAVEYAITKHHKDDINLIMSMSPNIDNIASIVNVINTMVPKHYEELKNNIIDNVKRNSPRSIPLSQSLKKRMANLPYMTNDTPKELRFGISKVIDKLYNTIISEVEEEEHPDDLEKYKYAQSKANPSDTEEIYDSYKPKRSVRFKNIW